MPSTGPSPADRFGAVVIGGLAAIFGLGALMLPIGYGMASSTRLVLLLLAEAFLLLVAVGLGVAARSVWRDRE